jgi:hypothetical protein
VSHDPDFLRRWDAARRRERLKAAAGWAVVLLAAVLVIALVVGGINQAMRSHRQTICNRLAETTGQETRYIELGRFDFDCYVLVNGRWVPRGQVRGDGE